MKMRFNLRGMAGGHSVGRLALITFLLAFTRAQAQPTIVSTVPTTGAAGVSTTAAVVFTFSEAMDTTATTATFYNESPFAMLTTSPVWSAGNTVLSCTPSPAFPAGATIIWLVSGQSPDGTSLGGTPEGTFTTSTTGSGNGVSGTNQYTAFAVGEAIYYDQASAGAPTLDTNIPPFLFFADVTLSSNQSALSATLELPSASVSNLLQEAVDPGQFFLTASDTNQAILTNTYGNGNYIFTLAAATSNEQVTVNLPASLLQPGAPQISNYTAAQSVNPAQAFTLTWDSFGGGTATDFVYVFIGSAFSTAPPGTSNALAGTATSVTIPANTLQPGSNYDSFISFYHLILPSNTVSAGYTTAAYRYAATEFNLTTTSGTTTPVILTNASWSGHTFSFNVTSAAGQSLVIQYNTNAPPLANQWQTLLATTNATGVVQVSDSANTTNRHVFYRAHTGP
ncbi:MAG: Ig-like domain-containing protein [Verrucomicrobiota bacterium]